MNFLSQTSEQSAVTSTNFPHHTEHLCKHRATAAKRCRWQTLNTLHQQCAAFKTTLNCLLVLPLPPTNEPRRLATAKTEDRYVHLALRQEDSGKIGKEFPQLEWRVFVFVLLWYQPSFHILRPAEPGSPFCPAAGGNCHRPDGIH